MKRMLKGEPHELGNMPNKVIKVLHMDRKNITEYYNNNVIWLAGVRLLDCWMFTVVATKVAVILCCRVIEV